MDVFGTRFQKELEQMKKEVAKWQSSPDGQMLSPPALPVDGEDSKEGEGKGHQKTRSVDNIPLLDSKSTNGSPVIHTKEQRSGTATSTGVDVGASKSATGLVSERKIA